jgi:hypothetical protein
MHRRRRGIQGCRSISRSAIGAPDLPPNLAPSSAAGLAEDANIGDLMKLFRWLAGKVLADHWFAETMLPQLHVLAWGNKLGV